MIKVECVSCKSPYDVDERRIPASGMKMRCPKCSTSLVIYKDGTTVAAGAAKPIAISPPVASGSPQPSAAGAFAAKPSAASAFGAPPSAASAFGAPAAKAAGAASRKTLLGAAAPVAEDAAALPKPELAGGRGQVASNSQDSSTDLPALKPAAKAAAPWGSLMPPGTDSKAPPPGPRAAAGFPKGALGGPNAAPLAAAGPSAAQKASTASAFGSSPTAMKQTMLGHARNPAQELAFSPPNASPAAKPQELPEIDADSPIELPYVDLPAHKPKTGANNAFRPAERPTSDPMVDLPAPKPPLAAKSPLAPTLPESPIIDLPAPKPAPLGLGKRPAFGSPAAKLVPPAPKLPELPALELPVPKPAAPAAANLPDVPLIDLPAPKPAVAAKVPPVRKPPEPQLIDLPAPKLAPPPQPLPSAIAARLPEPQLIDLPAPKAIAAPKVPPGPEPAPSAIAAKLPDMPMIDLPALKAIDLPALKTAANFDAGFGEVDLPVPKGVVDLPAPRPSPANFDELDLPTPKHIADLPALVGIADLPAPLGIADLPAPIGVTDLPVSRLGGFGDLDLPIPKASATYGAEEEISFGDLELPEAPGARGRRAKRGFGDIELPPPRAGADLVPPNAATMHGVGAPRRNAEDEASFGNLELGSPLPPYPEDSRFDDLRPDDLLALKSDPEALGLDLGSVPPALRDDGYGEAGLEPGDEDMEFGMAEGEAEGFALPPEILRRQRGEDLDISPADKSKRALHALIGVALLLVVVGGAGAALGFTDYGFFGSYFLEQFLPDAGNPTFAREAIARAEKGAAKDTYTDVRRSLVGLAEARHRAGLNRELLTRSALHEALYLMRFGTDTNSSAHVAAIMQRLDERHGLAPGMALARAADSARRSVYPEAEQHLAEARAQAPTDPYMHLLAGEVALRQAKLEAADKAFAAALKHGGGARAQWGVARVALARPDEAVHQAAIEETLKLSPLHAEARIAHAQLLFRQGKEDRAVQELRQALGLEPVEDQLMRASKLARAQGESLLGHIHEQRGRLHQARKSYEDSLSADPYLVEALLGSGRVLLRERRWNDALARFESALNLAQKAPGSVVLSGRKAEVEARLGQSRAELALGRAPDAKANLMTLLGDNPNDPEVILAMGQAEEGLGNKESAESSFRKSIELAPTSFAGYLALAQYYFKANQPDEASEALNDAASKVEENAEMRRMLGQSELVRNRLDSAAHEFKRALELDPQDLDARFGLASTYRRSNQLEQAQALFEEIAQRDPQFAGLTLERGQLLEAQGVYDKAIENYRTAIEKDPNDTALMLRLGAAQVEAGQLDEAEQTLDKVVHQIPNSADGEYYLGRVAFARGRGPDALTHFDRALSLDSSVPAYHLYAARTALDMTNLGRAIEEAEAAIKRDPKLGDAYWVRGIVRMRSGAVKDALKDAGRALELNPARFEAHALTAECYDELRQLPQAIEAFQTALAADPTRGEWWYKLGRVYLDLGSRPQGGEALEKSIKLGDARDPPPYWLADAYRLSGEAARARNDRRGAVSAYKRYLVLAPRGALDRVDVTKLLRSWNVELDD